MIKWLSWSSGYHDPVQSQSAVVCTSLQSDNWESNYKHMNGNTVLNTTCTDCTTLYRWRHVLTVLQCTDGDIYWLYYTVQMATCTDCTTLYRWQHVLTVLHCTDGDIYWLYYSVQMATYTDCTTMYRWRHVLTVLHCTDGDMYW